MEGNQDGKAVPEIISSTAPQPARLSELMREGWGEPGRWAIGCAADDDDTAAITFDIIIQTGFVPVRVGTPAQSGFIDAGGVLFPGLIGLFSPQGMQTTVDKGPFAL